LSRSPSRSIRDASRLLTVAGISARALEHPGLDQRLHDLFGEERIAARALVDPCSEARDARVATQEILEQVLDGLGPERSQGQLSVPGLLRPLGSELRAEVHDQQVVRPGDGIHPLLQEGLAGGVEPVKVLDERDQRIALSLNHALQDAEDELLAGVWIHLRRRIVGVRCPEALEHERQDLAKAGIEQQQSAGDLLPHGTRVVLVVEAVVGAEDLEHREERDVPPVGDRVSLEHLDSAGANALQELEAQAALAGPRIGDDAHDLPAPGHRLLQRVLQGLHIVVAANEACETAGPRDIEASSQGALAYQLVDPHGLLEPLDRERAEILEIQIAGDERRGRVAHVDRVGGRELLHARGQTHREPLGGVVHPQVVADLAHHDLARVQPDAGGEVEAVLALHFAGLVGEIVPELQRRIARALGMVLVGDGRTEERHHAVAGVLIVGAFEAVDSVRQHLKEAVHDLVPDFGIDGTREGDGSFHIREEDGDLLALALEG
jgi:hypothetical protein